MLSSSDIGCTSVLQRTLIISSILTEITEFNPDGTLQGFFHDNGRLRAQEPGLYYIYAQVFFENYADAPLYHNRVVLSVNHVPFSQMQTGLGGQADFGSKYTGGVIRLQQGDYIHLLTYYDSFLWVSKAHTFFGAFKIGE